MDKLTPKQKAFVDNYIENGRKATAEAVRLDIPKSMLQRMPKKILVLEGT